MRTVFSIKPSNILIWWANKSHPHKNNLNLSFILQAKRAKFPFQLYKLTQLTGIRAIPRLSVSSYMVLKTLNLQTRLSTTGKIINTVGWLRHCRFSHKSISNFHRGWFLYLLLGISCQQLPFSKTSLFLYAKKKYSTNAAIQCPSIQ